MREISGTAPLHSDTFYGARISAPYSCAAPAIVADLKRRAINPFFDGGLFGVGTEGWSVEQIPGGFSTVFTFKVSSPMDAYTCAYNVAQACIGIHVTPTHVGVIELDQAEQRTVGQASRPNLPDLGTLPDAAASAASAVESVAKIPLYLAALVAVGLIGYVYVTRAG